MKRLDILVEDITRVAVDAIANAAVRECAAYLERHPSFERVLLVAFREQDGDVLRSAVAAIG